MQGGYSVNIRHLTEGERRLILNSYKAFRNSSAGVGVLSMILAIVNAMFTDMFFCVFSFVVCIVSIGIAASLQKTKRNTEAALNEGVACDVYGTINKRLGGWAIGPIPFVPPKNSALQPGQQAYISVVQSLRGALGINGIQFPAMMIVQIPAGFNPNPAPVPQMGQLAAPQYAPQPSCPKCGKAIAADYAICPYCGFQIKAKCAACGRDISTNFAICPYCGAKR